MDAPYPPAPSVRTRMLGTTTEVRVTGELDLASCPLLQLEIDRAFAGHPEMLLIDMHGVGFIDSTVISALLAARARAWDTATRFMVLVSAGPVKRLFELCGLIEMLTTTDGPLPEPIQLRPRPLIPEIEGREPSTWPVASYPSATGD